jgi:hypothetical protein
VAFLSNSAHVVKKIACPSIPDSIISESETEEGLFLWNIEPEKIAEVLLKIALSWFEKNIPVVQKNGKSAELALYASQKELCQKALTKIQAANVHNDDIQIDMSTDKDDQIKRLQAKILEIESKK